MQQEALIWWREAFEDFEDKQGHQRIQVENEALELFTTFYK